MRSHHLIILANTATLPSIASAADFSYPVRPLRLALQERFTSLTFDSSIGSPEDFRKLLVSEDQRWKDVLKQVKIRLD